jgi:16S rRNA (guanine527-N7)-methyltransferase
LHMPLLSHDRTLVRDWLLSKNLMYSDDFIEKIGRYHDLIVFWSKKMNLISRSDLGSIIIKHFLDSLSPIDEISQNGKLIDIGSGAGFPGIPIALVRPELQVTLLESVHKKIRFLNAAKLELGQKNLNIVEKRLEEFGKKGEFDFGTIRALPHWEKLLPKSRALLCTGGKLIYYEKRGIYRIFDSEIIRPAED